VSSSGKTKQGKAGGISTIDARASPNSGSIFFPD
jgi:hypothetical protein